MRQAVTERTGIPGLIIEADHNDPRLYTIESLETQIGNFLSFWLQEKTGA